VVGRCAVVGIGSPHGDDRAGWAVIEALQGQLSSRVSLHQAKVPLEVMDWLDGLAALHLVDSGQAAVAWRLPQRFQLLEDDRSSPPRLRFVAHGSHDATAREQLALLPPLRSAGTHQLDLLTVLELAQCLDRLPPQVVLWVIPGFGWDMQAALSEGCQEAIYRCLGQLRQELSDA
jgi:Ni,Fe-hydrogenase maturation factor